MTTIRTKTRWDSPTKADPPRSRWPELVLDLGLFLLGLAFGLWLG